MARKSPVAEFVHLHNHTHYSLLDGAMRIEEMVAQAVEFGMPAVAITDHGNLHGAVRFYKQARAAGLKPIVGCEVYVAPGSRHERGGSGVAEASYHLTLLCRNEAGYHNLMKLSSLGFLEGFYYRPRIDKELLAAHSAGLIAMSGCLKGEVNYHLNRGDPERALKAAAEYQEIMGHDSYFLEVMRNGFEGQDAVIPGVVELSATLGVPVVATNDCHYLRQDDALAHDAMFCIQTGKKLNDDGRLRMSGAQLFFRSPAEMAQAFSGLPEAVRQTRAVADQCELKLDFDKVQFRLPRYHPPEGFEDMPGYLEHLAREGLRRRCPGAAAAYEERLAHELGVINEMGFPGYFLVVKDIVDFARREGIPVGPGRGSAAGSLVLYCLGITDIDPLRHNLLFERFLNTERVTLPDVDIDFADDRRQEIVNYIRERYGEDTVAQTITFGTMQSRAAVRDVGRVMDVPIAEVDRLAKLIPPGMKLGPALGSSTELRRAVQENPVYSELMKVALRLEGLNRHASIHASAVVIAPDALMEVLPLYRMPDGAVCTQFDMYSLDDVGLLKLDVLGLRTLTVVEQAARFIQETGGSYDPAEASFDDLATYELIQRGDTGGVFQLESAGMRDLCRRMRPESLEHITALIALYRPGPMDLIPAFIARKEGREKIEYEHPLLEPICCETYGIMIYQEQVMQAAQALAGYSLGSADLLRRAMGKKKPEQMAAQAGTFIEGCARTNDIPKDKAKRIFELLAKFAGYGFNKSHAAGYACLSYATAFLKANYPVEFIAATLASEIGDSKKLAKFIAEARHMDVDVLRPDVNRSLAQFSIEGGRVRFALAGVRHVGGKAAELVVKEREERGQYKDLLEFLVRNRGTVNRKAVESLVKAGAFDGFDSNRQRLLDGLDVELARAGSERLRLSELQGDMFASDAPEAAPPPEPRFGTDELLAFEKEAFGFYFSSHPLEPWRVEYQGFDLLPTGQLTDRQDGDAVAVGGVITSRRSRKDKRDREYFIVTLEDFVSSVEVMVFADQLEKYRGRLQTDRLVVVQGRVKIRDEVGVPQIWADRVMLFEDLDRYVRVLVITLPAGFAEDAKLARLRELVAESPGETMLYLGCRDGSGRYRLHRAKELNVRPVNRLVNELRKLFGDRAVELRGDLPPVETGFRRRRRPSKTG
ncbi:MAG: DNA polymerase III subunit alpha [bacterium]